jgi:Zn-dependent protease with chaperone function
LRDSASSHKNTLIVIATVLLIAGAFVLLFWMGILGVGVWQLLSQKDYDIDDPEIVQLVEKAPAEVIPVQPPESTSQAIWSLNTPYDKKLNEVGQRLMQVNQIKPAIQFKVLKKQPDSQSNTESKQQKQKPQWAFAVPAKRTVYFSREAMSLIQSDSELACILGHEIAHIMFNQASIAHILLKDKAEQDQNYQMEHEADAVGIFLAEKAGYHPLGMVYFFKTMSDLEDNGKIQYDFSGTIQSHPPDASRIRVIHYVIRQRFARWAEKPFEMEQSLYQALWDSTKQFDEMNVQLKNETQQMLPIRDRLEHYPYAYTSDFEADKARFNQWVSGYNAKVKAQDALLNEIQRLQSKFQEG